MEYKSVDYSFTVTLKPIVCTAPPEYQYDRTYLEIIKRLRCLNCKITCVAELTKNYDIHYHGIISFNVLSKSYEKDFKDLFRSSRIFGYNYIKQIDDMPGWSQYIGKDLNSFRDIMNRPPILIDEYNIFETIKNDFIRQIELISDQ